MTLPEDAKKVLDEHFRQITLDGFKARHAKYVSEGQTALALPPADARADNQIILYQPEAAPLRLEAYLACALTGLNAEQRRHAFLVSDIVDAVCQELEIDLYQPRKATDPVNHTDVSAEQVFQIDKERVLSSDLVIHICDYPSTGSGEELDFALAALIPIVLLSHAETRVSRMVTGIPAFKLIVTYADLDELRIELKERLREIRPILEERKLAFAVFDKNIVGNRIRLLREEQHLTREDLASHSSDLITVNRLRNLEESTDKISNPSLLELRSLSAILKTTVADLLEPDLNERLMVLLQDWVVGRSEARYGISVKDRNRILTRILLRMADSLQRE
jgi:transcriptional regulator with XRE-family HTH domain/nucleoside 2-deoxyribosyltransferase